MDKEINEEGKIMDMKLIMIDVMGHEWNFDIRVLPSWLSRLGLFWMMKEEGLLLT